MVNDKKKEGVLNPTMSKVKSLKFATEVTITIHCIDFMIKLNPRKREVEATKTPASLAS